MISRCMFSNSCSLCISSIFRRVCKSMQWFKSIVASCTISVPFIIWLVTLLHNWIMYLPQEDRWAFHTDVRTYYQIIIFIICICCPITIKSKQIVSSFWVYHTSLPTGVSLRQIIPFWDAEPLTTYLSTSPVSASWQNNILRDRVLRNSRTIGMSKDTH